MTTQMLSNDRTLLSWLVPVLSEDAAWALFLVPLALFLAGLFLLERAVGAESDWVTIYGEVLVPVLAISGTIAVVNLIP